MKFLIVGLGNPGYEYHGNRHNIGFMVLDALAQKKEKEFEQDRHCYSLDLRIKGKQVKLIKPTTFMNLSGKAVRYHLQQHKISPKNMMVITDDIALPYGKLRLRARGSHGGHNGLRHISELLGNNDWARLRFGVGDDFKKGRQADYVLSDFDEMEQAELPAYIEKCHDYIQAFCTIGIDRAMSTLNKK